MRYRAFRILVIGGVFSLLTLATALPALARIPKAGLAEVPSLRQKLHSKKRKVRSAALWTLLSRVTSNAKAVGALAPLVRRMAKRDAVCDIRTDALRVLVWRRGDLGSVPQREILGALADRCPLAQARGANHVEHLTAKQRRKAVNRLLSLARNSPYYHVQCSALLALGKLRVKRAHKLMAQALALGAKTGLSGSGASYNLGVRTMPQCAVRALERLRVPRRNSALATLKKKRDALARKMGNKRLAKKQRRLIAVQYWRVHARLLKHTLRQRPAPTVADVQRWRDRLSKRGLVKKSPTPLCLSSISCPLGRSCARMTCLRNTGAFFLYRGYQRHRAKKRRKPKYAWKNHDDPLAVRLGLGLGGVDWVRSLLSRRRPASKRSLRYRELTKRARKLWLHGRCRESLKWSRQAYKLKASRRVAQLIAVCACSVGNARLARWAYRRVSATTKRMMTRICRRRGISIP